MFRQTSILFVMSYAETSMVCNSSFLTLYPLH